MKKIKYVFVLLCFISISTLNYSCSNYTVENESIVSRYNTEEVFDGIILAKGRLANQLPSLDPSFTSQIYEDLTVEQLKSLEGFKNSIFDKLNKKDPSILTDFTDNIHSNNPYEIENAIKLFYKEYVSVLNEMPLFQQALKETENLKYSYSSSSRDSVLTNFKSRAKNQISSSAKSNEKYFVDQQGFTSVAPVICLTLIVWNVGVAVNVAAAVNVAVGVNLAFAVNVAAAVNVTFNGTNSGGGGGTNSGDDDPGLAVKSSNTMLSSMQELAIDDISVAESLVQEIIEATHN